MDKRTPQACLLSMQLFRSLFLFMMPNTFHHCVSCLLAKPASFFFSTKNTTFDSNLCRIWIDWMSYTTRFRLLYKIYVNRLCHGVRQKMCNLNTNLLTRWKTKVLERNRHGMVQDYYIKRCSSKLSLKSRKRGLRKETSRVIKEVYTGDNECSCTSVEEWGGGKWKRRMKQRKGECCYDSTEQSTRLSNVPDGSRRNACGVLTHFARIFSTVPGRCV